MSVDIFKQDGKLVSAEPTQRVAREGLCQSLRDSNEKFVPRLISVTVVDILEVVQVYEHYGDRGRTSVSLCEGLIYAIYEQRPVRKVGERVV